MVPHIRMVGAHMSLRRLSVSALLAGTGLVAWVTSMLLVWTATVAVGAAVSVLASVRSQRRAARLEQEETRHQEARQYARRWLDR